MSRVGAHVELDYTPSLPAWVTPVSLTLLLHVALLAGYLGAFHGDVSALVCADRDKIGEYPFEHVTTGFGTGGFDGQFYYALARDPWTPRADDFDNLGYRRARPLYYGLGYALSGGGEPRLLLWVLPALNLFAVAGLGWLGATWAVRHGRAALWGVLLPVVVNAGTPMLRDLTDPLSLFAVAGLLVGTLLGWRAWVVGLWAAAAVLSREQNVVVVGLLLMTTLCQRRWGVAGTLGLAAALWAGWMAALYHLSGELPFSGGNLDMPFAGVASRLQRPEGAGGLPIHAAALGILGVQLGLSLVMGWFRPGWALWLTALAGAALAVVGGAAVYADGTSYTRVFAWMPLAVWLWAVGSGRGWPVALLTPAALWPCFAVAQVWLR